MSVNHLPGHTHKEWDENYYSFIEEQQCFNDEHTYSLNKPDSVFQQIMDLAPDTVFGSNDLYDYCEKKDDPHSEEPEAPDNNFWISVNHLSVQTYKESDKNNYSASEEQQCFNDEHTYSLNKPDSVFQQIMDLAPDTVFGSNDLYDYCEKKDDPHSEDPKAPDNNFWMEENCLDTNPYFIEEEYSTPPRVLSDFEKEHDQDLHLEEELNTHASVSMQNNAHLSNQPKIQQKIWHFQPNLDVQLCFQNYFAGQTSFDNFPSQPVYNNISFSQNLVNFNPNNAIPGILSHLYPMPQQLHQNLLTLYNAESHTRGNKNLKINTIVQLYQWCHHKAKTDRNFDEKKHNPTIENLSAWLGVLEHTIAYPLIFDLIKKNILEKINDYNLNNPQQSFRYINQPTNISLDDYSSLQNCETDIYVSSLPEETTLMTIHNLGARNEYPQDFTTTIFFPAM